MNKFLTSALLSAVIFPVHAQTVVQLQNCWWEAAKVTEVIKGDTTIYGSRYCMDSLDNKYAIYFPEELRVSAYFASDSKYMEGYDPVAFPQNDPTFNPHSFTPEARASGTWQLTGEQNIEIKIDQKSIKESNAKNFSGSLVLIDVSDSTATFQKNISGNGDWIRQYDFVKR